MSKADKKYRIEIWRYHAKIDTYESNDIKEILNWYKNNYQILYDYGGCAFDIYEDNKLLDFETEDKLGFYDYEE